MSGGNEQRKHVGGTARSTPEVPPGWLEYGEYAGKRTHTVAGRVVVQPGVWSPQLENHRDILVYLPPSYGRGEARYPVLYMHDGQNLFDRHTSFVGEWKADEALEALSREGLEAIVVGVPNMGVHRIFEYGPFKASQGGGGGDLYLEFVTQTLKPLIDKDFRTKPDRRSTGALGSSMGGLISLYGYFRYPEVFGFAGVMSPSIWFANQGIVPYVRDAAFSPGRIYLDMGCLEGRGRNWRERVVSFCLRQGPLYDARRMYQVLRSKGYRPGRDLMYVEDPEGQHNEAAWASRLPKAIRFFLKEG